MSCFKCSDGVWVCGPGAADECGTIPNVDFTDREPEWYYMGQRGLTAGKWYVNCQPGCLGFSLSEENDGSGNEVDIPEDAWYVVLCKKGGSTHGCNVALVKAGA